MPNPMGLAPCPLLLGRVDTIKLPKHCGSMPGSRLLAACLQSMAMPCPLLLLAALIAASWVIMPGTNLTAACP